MVNFLTDLATPTLAQRTDLQFGGTNSPLSCARIECSVGLALRIVFSRWSTGRAMGWNMVWQERIYVHCQRHTSRSFVLKNLQRLFGSVDECTTI